MARRLQSNFVDGTQQPQRKGHKCADDSPGTGIDPHKSTGDDFNISQGSKHDLITFGRSASVSSVSRLFDDLHNSDGATHQQCH